MTLLAKQRNQFAGVLDDLGQGIIVFSEDGHVTFSNEESINILNVGDIINIELNPEKINDSSFVLRFKFKKNGEKIGTANIKHVSINPITRDICELSKQIKLWLHESSLNC